jgi:hypothetical protein
MNHGAAPHALDAAAAWGYLLFMICSDPSVTDDTHERDPDPDLRC